LAKKKKKLREGFWNFLKMSLAFVEGWFLPKGERQLQSLSLPQVFCSPATGTNYGALEVKNTMGADSLKGTDWPGQWLTPVILATQEAEIRRITV
jgi:hypothetical protein